IRATVALIDANDDLRRCGIVVHVADQVVFGRRHREIEELADVAVEQVRHLIPLLRDRIVRRQVDVYHAFFAEHLRRHTNGSRLSREWRGRGEYQKESAESHEFKVPVALHEAKHSRRASPPNLQGASTVSPCTRDRECALSCAHASRELDPWPVCYPILRS